MESSPGRKENEVNIFGKWVTRLASWQEELLDRHVIQKQSTRFLFLSVHKHLQVILLIGAGILSSGHAKLCCPMKSFNTSESM